MDKNNINQKLIKLTENFTKESVAVRLFSEKSKNEALKIFDEHYLNIKTTSGVSEGKNCWVVKCESLKLNEEDLDIFGDDDLDFNDTSDFGYNDTTDDANQLTVLKKQTADLAEKWKASYQQLVDVAKKLNLIISHDEDLNVKIEKSNTESQKLDRELNIDKEVDNDEIDDSFGPSEFDNRASELGDDIDIESKQTQESLQSTSVTEDYSLDSNIGTIKLNTNSDPNELYLDDSMVDDDF